MLLDISKAKKDPGSICHVDTVQVIEDILFLKNSYHFTQPVKLSADYVYTDGQLSMEGFFETSIEVECSRCLQLFEYPLHIDFQEVFFQEENADFDDEVYTFEEDKLSLDRMIIDNILLSLPAKFLCREDCKGICPGCGVNLNKEACRCDHSQDEADVSDSPFAQLQGLFEKDEEV